MADRQFAAVNAKLSKIYASDIAIFTIFTNKADDSQFDEYYQTWVKERLSGLSNVFTVTDLYGFSSGPDARTALIDLRTMKILSLQPAEMLDQMIDTCDKL